MTRAARIAVIGGGLGGAAAALALHRCGFEVAVYESRANPLLPGRVAVPRTPRKPGTADGEGLSCGSAGSGTPRLALPGNLPRSLRYLDDGQLDELLRAAAAEARRRGWKVQAEPHPGRPKRDVSESAPRPTSRSRAQPVSPGLERIVRAALAAGVKPGAIARQFGLPRAEVQRVGSGLGRKR